MNKIKIPVSQSKVGDIIAKNLLDRRGITLVSKDIVINQYIIDMLTNIGIDDVWIYPTVESEQDNPSNYEKVVKSYKETVLTVKEILMGLTSGGKLNHEKVISLSKQLYGDFTDSIKLIKCLNDIKNVDEYTYTHCINVAFYAMLTAKWLNLSEENILEVINAALLHDIGKVLIPIEILNKNGKLTEEEFSIMKNHSAIGYNVIKDLTEFSTLTKEAVLLHHERIDGKGYPYGLKGDAINLYAKIIGIADVFDAMTQDRVYKKGVNPFEAFKMFSNVGYEIFDVRILNIFLKNIVVNYIGLQVILDSGETGEIVYVPPYDILNPIIFKGTAFIDLAISKKKIIGIG